MGAARRQLARIMSLSLASAAGRKAIAGRRRAHPAGQDALQQAVEGSVAKDPGKHVLECLRRAIAAGWADQVRLSFSFCSFSSFFFFFLNAHDGSKYGH